MGATYSSQCTADSYRVVSGPLYAGHTIQTVGYRMAPDSIFHGRPWIIGKPPAAHL